MRYNLNSLGDVFIERFCDLGKLSNRIENSEGEMYQEKPSCFYACMQCKVLYAEIFNMQKKDQTCMLKESETLQF